MKSVIKKASFAIGTGWPKSFELGRSLPIFSVATVSEEMKTDFCVCVLSLLLLKEQSD